MDGVKNPLRFLSVLMPVGFQPEFPESRVTGVNPADPRLSPCTTLPVETIVRPVRGASGPERPDLHGKHVDETPPPGTTGCQVGVLTKRRVLRRAGLAGTSAPDGAVFSNGERRGVSPPVLMERHSEPAGLTSRFAVGAVARAREKWLTRSSRSAGTDSRPGPPTEACSVLR